MKLLTFLLFVSVASVTANSYSQQTKFSLSLENITVREVFQRIEEDSEFIFLYSEKSVDVNRKVSVKVRNETVETILDQVFRGSANYYEIHDRQIAILPMDNQGLPSLPVFTREPEKETGLAQQKKISGKVTDTKGEPLPGVSVVVKGTTMGTVTDSDGNYNLTNIPDDAVLVFSFIGMKSREIKTGNQTSFNITLQEEVVGMEEVVIVGYGQQKKASVVGAITATSGEDLQRTGGITNVAQALTGLLPGVTTIQLTGQPGYEDPLIYIRGQSTWNGGQPYILVDGVERRMNDLDMSEIDNISVLKDASATAVFGVKGANGVILVTTKRGSKGKPVLSVSANSTMKFPVRLVDKLDAYDTYRVKNDAIEREVVVNEGSWQDFTPVAIMERYRNQENLKYPEAYPNVDWQKETIKDYAFDHRVDVNVAGGTDFAKYFSSLAYLHEGDLMKIRDNDKGYDPGFAYDRFNFRTNLDLNLTKTTALQFNLSGYFSTRKSVVSNELGAYDYSTNAQFSIPANAYLPRYADGRWGLSPNTDTRMANSAAFMANNGYRLLRTTNLTADLGITQQLGFITPGLSGNVRVSFDNNFLSSGGVSATAYPTKWINPAIEDMPEGGNPDDYIIIGPAAGLNQFSWATPYWGISDEQPQLDRLRRRLFYQVQLNYDRSFGKHQVTATGVFTREQLATGSEFQRYREDWVSRATYNFDNRYFAEFNGAYNGSEQFGPGYRFDFFPSAAIGWTLSQEPFLRELKWLDKLKVRYSYGKVGDDGALSQRWLYESQWTYGGSWGQGPNAGSSWSPYTIYAENVVGNSGIHWEKAKKTNLGFEATVLNNMLAANVEYFTEDRTDILLVGSSRVLPVYYGAKPPTANVGRVKVTGYEYELRFNKNLHDWHIWAMTSMTHAVDKVLEKEEPQLLYPHQKQEGFQISQDKTVISAGFLDTWDEIYASAPYSDNDQVRLPGDYRLIDFDANGKVDGFDNAPYGYSTRPQNNYSLTLGVDYKGFSAMVQFYGVNNVTRDAPFENFVSNIDIAYQHTLDHWTKNNTDAASFFPRWKSVGEREQYLIRGQYFHYDGSYVRLKNAELAYTFSGERLQRSGISSLRVYLNGNNLFFWSDLPDDREQGWNVQGAYPISRRVNLGFDIKF